MSSMESEETFYEAFDKWRAAHPNLSTQADAWIAAVAYQSELAAASQGNQADTTPRRELLTLLDAVDAHLKRVFAGESLNPLVARDWLSTLSSELRSRFRRSPKSSPPLNLRRPPMPDEHVPELLPCPFCGQLPETDVSVNGKGFFVWCSDENCIAHPEQDKAFDSKESAQKAWNTRATRTVPATAAQDEVLTVIQELLALMDDGILIRDTKDDADFLAFAKQGMRITKAIGAAHEVIAATPRPERIAVKQWVANLVRAGISFSQVVEVGKQKQLQPVSRADVERIAALPSPPSTESEVTGDI